MAARQKFLLELQALLPDSDSAKLRITVDHYARLVNVDALHRARRPFTNAKVRHLGREDAPCAGTPWNSSERSFSC